MIREPVPAIAWAYHLRGIPLDQEHKVKQGTLQLWYCASLLVGQLVIGKSATTPGAIIMYSHCAYRNTTSPQDIADDIYNSNQGDDTVAQLTPGIAAATLGHRGGSARSARKAKSAAKNGKLGGRPRKKR